MERCLYDAKWISNTLECLASEAVTRLALSRNVAVVGIRSRGAVLAERLAKLLESRGFKADLGQLDITLYRDDISEGGGRKAVKASDISFDMDDRQVLLVDDVLYTGRTIRAAMTELMDFGRPACIRLITLIDRGGRELPIQADLVGGTVSVSARSKVRVKLQELDGKDEVVEDAGK